MGIKTFKRRFQRVVWAKKPEIVHRECCDGASLTEIEANRSVAEVHPQVSVKVIRLKLSIPSRFPKSHVTLA